MRTITLLALIPLCLQAQKATSLRGSKAALLEQNRVANQEKLSRLQDDGAIKKFVEHHRLVPIPNGTSGIVVNPALPANRRYCRPETIRFLRDLGSKFERKFGQRLMVNSCIRDVTSQEKLRKTNKNAAPASGPTASSHLTGATVDIRHFGFALDKKKFIRAELKRLEARHQVEATEEHTQKVWHVMVYQSYGSKPKPRTHK